MSEATNVHFVVSVSVRSIELRETVVGASSSRCAGDAGAKAKLDAHATAKVTALPISTYHVHAMFVPKRT